MTRGPAGPYTGPVVSPLRLTANDPCFLCGRESDMTVSVDGRLEGLCSVCFEKADVDEGDSDA